MLLSALVIITFGVGGFVLIVVGVMQRSLWLAALGIWITAGAPGVIATLTSSRYLPGIRSDD